MKDGEIKLTAPNLEARELWKGFIYSVVDQVALLARCRDTRVAVQRHQTRSAETPDTRLAVQRHQTRSAETPDLQRRDTRLAVQRHQTPDSQRRDTRHQTHSAETPDSQRRDTRHQTHSAEPPDSQRRDTRLTAQRHQTPDSQRRDTRLAVQSHQTPDSWCRATRLTAQSHQTPDSWCRATRLAVQSHQTHSAETPDTRLAAQRHQTPDSQRRDTRHQTRSAETPDSRRRDTRLAVQSHQAPDSWCRATRHQTRSAETPDSWCRATRHQTRGAEPPDSQYRATRLTVQRHQTRSAETPDSRCRATRLTVQRHQTRGAEPPDSQCRDTRLAVQSHQTRGAEPPDSRLNILTQFLQIGAVGVEVEGHQAFWTCDYKPFILVLTTVPPHTDSLGVSTKTKAGLLMVPTTLTLLPGQLQMLREVVEKERQRRKRSLSRAPSSPLSLPLVGEIPACFRPVSRTEAEVLLERHPDCGNMLLRPGRDGTSLAVTTRQDLNGSVFRHYRVTQKQQGGYIIDVENPIPCPTLHDVINALVEKTAGTLQPFLLEEPYEENITYISSNDENGERTLHCAPMSMRGPALPPKVPERWTLRSQNKSPSPSHRSLSPPGSPSSPLRRLVLSPSPLTQSECVTHAQLYRPA
ncbi:hypothetical protein NFI96_029492, partial [Prochilodus magdalenae]